MNESTARPHLSHLPAAVWDFLWLHAIFTWRFAGMQTRWHPQSNTCLRLERDTTPTKQEGSFDYWVAVF